MEKFLNHFNNNLEIITAGVVVSFFIYKQYFMKDKLCPYCQAVLPKSLNEETRRKDQRYGWVCPSCGKNVNVSFWGKPKA